MRKEVWKEEGAKTAGRRGRTKEKLKKEGGKKERRTGVNLTREDDRRVKNDHYC